MKQFLSLFRTNAKALRLRHKKLQDAIKAYEGLLYDMVWWTMELYKCRQMAYDRLASLQYYVLNLQKSPVMLVKSIDRALDFASVMKEARDAEWENMKDNIVLPSKYVLGMEELLFKASSADRGGKTDTTPVDVSVVLLAIATTFGSRTDDTTKSAIGKLDSVNAAMSCMRQSQAGVMSGMALALLGPLTFPLIHVGLAASVIYATKKRSDNDQKIEEVNRLMKEVDGEIVKINRVIEDIKSMLSTTSILLESVDASRLPLLPVNFDSEEYPKTRLLTMVDDAKTLGKLTDVSISTEN